MGCNIFKCLVHQLVDCACDKYNSPYIEEPEHEDKDADMDGDNKKDNNQGEDQDGDKYKERDANNEQFN